MVRESLSQVMMASVKIFLSVTCYNASRPGSSLAFFFCGVSHLGELCLHCEPSSLTWTTRCILSAPMCGLSNVFPWVVVATLVACEVAGTTKVVTTHSVTHP